MRFIDYNGSGDIDAQDIALSVAIEEAAQEDGAEERHPPQQLSSNAGCATMAAIAAPSILIILLAL